MEQLPDFKHEAWAVQQQPKKYWRREGDKGGGGEKKKGEILTLRKRGFHELTEVIPTWNSMHLRRGMLVAKYPSPVPSCFGTLWLYLKLCVWEQGALVSSAAPLRATPAPRRRWHCGVRGSKPGQAGPGPGAAPRGRAAGGAGLGAARDRERPGGSTRPSGLSWTLCCVLLALLRLSPRHGRGATLIPGLPGQLPRRLWLRRRAARPTGARVPPAPRYRGRGAAAAWGGDRGGAGGLKWEVFFFFFLRANVSSDGKTVPSHLGTVCSWRVSVNDFCGLCISPLADTRVCMHLLLQVRCNESAKIPHVRKGVDAQDLNISKNLRKKKKEG